MMAIHVFQTTYWSNEQFVTSAKVKPLLNILLVNILIIEIYSVNIHNVHFPGSYVH